MFQSKRATLLNRGRMWMLFVLGMFGVSTTTNAAPETLAEWSEDGVAVSIVRDGKRAELRWTLLLEQPWSATKESVSTCRGAKNLVSGEQSITPMSGKKDAFRLVQETPFFLPEAWYELQCSARHEDNKRVLTWKRIRGSSSVYQRTWTLQPKGAKTEVVHRFVIELPFDVPDVFARRRLRQQVVEDVQSFRNWAAQLR